MFGPPDELEEHLTPIPSQRWRYRYIEGIGNDVNMEFVDTAKNGEFHMTMDPNGKGTEIRRPPGPPKADASGGARLAVDTRKYVIGPEDVLYISVWRENSLTGQYGVRPDGKIAVPLIGDLQAAGFTPERLADQFIHVLGPYLINPEISVSVIHVNRKPIVSEME